MKKERKSVYRNLDIIITEILLLGICPIVIYMYVHPKPWTKMYTDVHFVISHLFNNPKAP